MSSGADRIVFEDEDGYPRELVTAEDRTRAIAGGALRPDTLVTLYRDRASPVAVRAIDIPDLCVIFQASRESIAPKAEPAPAPAQRHDRPPTSSAPAPLPDTSIEAVMFDHPSDEVVANDNEDYETYEEYEDAEAERGERYAQARRSNRAWPPVLAALIVIIGLVWLINAASRRPSSNPTPAVATYTVKLDANARAAPEKNAQILGIAHRGDAISGVLTRSTNGQMWLKVQDGPLNGRFIWSGALEPVAPSTPPS
jgi:hypothetical protein